MPRCWFNVLNVQLQNYIYYWSLEIFKSTFCSYLFFSIWDISPYWSWHLTHYCGNKVQNLTQTLMWVKYNTFYVLFLRTLFCLTKRWKIQIIYRFTWKYIICLRCVLYNRKPYFFRIGRPDKSVFFSYCTLCKGSNSLIFVICLLKHVEFHVFKMVDPRSYGLQIEKFIELWTNKKKIGDSVLVQSKGKETIYFNKTPI
jgi:hypothetical protein